MYVYKYQWTKHANIIESNFLLLTVPEELVLSK